MGNLYRRFWHPVPTGQVAERVYAVRVGGANMFVYTDGQNVIGIDSTSSAGAVQAEFRQLPLEPTSLSHLFLTHTDFDHTGGMAAFPGAHIYLSRAEEQMIDGTTPRMLWVYHNRKIDRPYTLLADGEIVTVGEIKVEAIATPGHTPGAVSYLVNDSVLFTGDTLALWEGRVRTFYRFFNMDTATQRNSIRKLARFEEISLLCTAHTGCTTDFAGAMEPWLS